VYQEFSHRHRSYLLQHSCSNISFASGILESVLTNDNGVDKLNDLVLFRAGEEKKHSKKKKQKT